MKNIKNKLLFLTLFLIICMTITVKADNYSITLNGVDYTCKSKSESFGNGMPKTSYSSSEEARIDCTKHQSNYINSIKEIRIFDDPTKCTFEETDLFYNCNCHSTVYHGCEQVNANQKPTYSEKHTIEVKFMNETNSVYDKKVCDASSSECKVTTPSYTCQNGQVFNGWTSDKNCSSNPTGSNESLYFASSGKINTYFTYYPCCGGTINTNNSNNTNNTNNSNNTNNTNNNNNTINDNSSNNNNSNNTNSNITEQEQNTNQNNTTNNQETQNNNEDDGITKVDSDSTGIIIIILIILFVILIILVIVYCIYKKKPSNKKDDDSKKENPYANYYNKKDDDDNDNPYDNYYG